MATQPLSARDTPAIIDAVFCCIDPGIRNVGIVLMDAGLEKVLDATVLDLTPEERVYRIEENLLTLKKHLDGIVLENKHHQKDTIFLIEQQYPGVGTVANMWRTMAIYFGVIGMFADRIHVLNAFAVKKTLKLTGKPSVLRRFGPIVKPFLESKGIKAHRYIHACDAYALALFLKTSQCKDDGNTTH